MPPQAGLWIAVGGEDRTGRTDRACTLKVDPDRTYICTLSTRSVAVALLLHRLALFLVFVHAGLGEDSAALHDALGVALLEL